MSTLAKTSLSIILLIWGAVIARANDAYYLIVFAAQHRDNQAKYSHTFAAFLKVTDGEAAKPSMESAVISWLPATGSVDLRRLRPEAGKNFGLQETLDWAAKEQDRVTGFGPFVIKKELYESAQRQVRKLESGTVLYKAVEFVRGTSQVTNCIHAVCDLDIVKDHLVTGKARGEQASEMIARFFRPWILRADPLPRWVAERLGLTKDKIAYRALD
jgi:hypothetical protein